MAKKDEVVVPIARFRRNDPLQGVPEIPLGQAPEEARTTIVTPTPMVDLAGMPKVWLMLGNGGTGKTTYARWMIARMVEQGRSATLAALDPGSRALSAWFNGIEQPPTRDSGRTEKWLAEFLDFLMADKGPAILDFGAAGEVSLRALVDSTTGLVGDLEAAGLGVVACYMLSPRIWDIEPLTRMEAAGFRPTATLIVLNEGRVDSLDDPQQAFAPVLRHSTFRKAVERGAIPLWLPGLDADIMSEIEAKLLHFGMVRDGKVPAGAVFSPIGGLRRNKVTRWLERMEQVHAPIRSWLP